MWKVTLILLALIVAAMVWARHMDDTAEEREERREINRKARAGHRQAMNRLNGIQPSGTRWNGAMRYNKKGL